LARHPVTPAADLNLNQLARDTGAIQRLRGITDAADLLRLELTRTPGRCRAACSLEDLEVPTSYVVMA
jgi:hypothetical protein